MGNRIRAKVSAWVGWAVTHRRKIVSALVVVLPLVSRYVPDFPADAILSAVRAFLGA